MYVVVRGKYQGILDNCLFIYMLEENSGIWRKKFTE